MSRDCLESVQKLEGNEEEKSVVKLKSETKTEEETEVKSEETEDEQFSLKAREREMRLGFPRCYPVIWVGDLFLANFEARIEIRFLHGDLAVFKKAKPACTADFPEIHVRKKLKFDDVPQKYMKEKILAEEGCCVLIALPLGSDAFQWKQLQEQFIFYFNQKKIVGVSELPQKQKGKTGRVFTEPEFEKVETASDKSYGMATSTSTTDKEFASKRPTSEMLLFPPSEFVAQNLSLVAPKLLDLLHRDKVPHLMLVMSEVFDCFRCAKFLEKNNHDIVTDNED